MRLYDAILINGVSRYAALALRPGTRGFATDVCVPISKLTGMVAYAKDQIKQLQLTGAS
jgi:D-lactate dehydrogenase (cytochrome)